MVKHQPTGPVGGISPFEDDSVGYDEVERAYIRREFEPDFEWVRFARPSRRNPLRVPLDQARVGLVSTAGAHLPDQRPAGAGGGIRLIPVGAPAVMLTHEGYDTRRASADPEVVFPVRALQRLAAKGFVGSVAPTV